MAQLLIQDLVDQVRAGNLISFPTDTVPALAARPDSAEKIYQAKNRDLRKPLILMGADPSNLWPYIQSQSPDFQAWQAIADQYWPGALTLVLPASARVPGMMHPHTPDTIGIRVPNCAIARQILRQTGPLATTSINHSGQAALITLAQIEAEFPEVDVPQAQYWPAPKQEAIASTVIEWKKTDWIVHRQGTVTVSQAHSRKEI